MIRKLIKLVKKYWKIIVLVTAYVVVGFLFVDCMCKVLGISLEEWSKIPKLGG